MTAREMLKGKKPKGKILKCSKGGYRDNTFAYYICDDGEKYNIVVLSKVNPREYSVNYNEKTNVETLETAILYNEWKARTIDNGNKIVLS